MRLLKKDIENLPESHCISWQYAHLEDQNDILSNNFDAIVTYNVKDKWLIIQLFRYGIGNNPQEIMLDQFWFVPNVEKLDEYFIPLEELHEKIYEELQKNLNEEYFTLCDYSDSANILKNQIEEQKRLIDENQTTNQETE